MLPSAASFRHRAWASGLRRASRITTRWNGPGNTVGWRCRALQLARDCTTWQRWPAVQRSVRLHMERSWPDCPGCGGPLRVVDISPFMEKVVTVVNRGAITLLVFAALAIWSSEPKWSAIGIAAALAAAAALWYARTRIEAAFRAPTFLCNRCGRRFNQRSIAVLSQPSGVPK